MYMEQATGCMLHEATVTGLPELFSSFGHMATAHELYEWWGQARVIAYYCSDKGVYVFIGNCISLLRRTVDHRSWWERLWPLVLGLGNNCE